MPAGHAGWLRVRSVAAGFKAMSDRNVLSAGNATSLNSLGKKRNRHPWAFCQHDLGWIGFSQERMAGKY